MKRRQDASLPNRHGSSGHSIGPAWIFWVFWAVSFFSGCTRSVNQAPVLPPATYPLTREHIGYGVINVSFTHFYDEPGPGGVSRGYLRRGTIARIIERRPLIVREKTESWVYVEGNYQGAALPSQGWVQEANLDVYENESKAITASRAISQ